MEQNRKPSQTQPQNLMLENREKLLVQGVQRVESFDENSVLLDTLLGALVIRGRGLQVDRVDPESGEVAVTGEITALIYDESRVRGGMLARLLR